MRDRTGRRAALRMMQRDRARHRSRRQALRDNRRLLRRAPAPPPRRSRQNLNPPETVPINWQITWQTSLPASTEQGRIIRSLSAPAICEQRLAYGASMDRPWSARQKYGVFSKSRSCAAIHSAWHRGAYGRRP